MIATAVESMSSFQDADATFRADAPPLPATEPALAFIGPPRRRLWAAPRQDHASNAAIDRRLFIGRGAETTVARGQIWRAAKDRLMSIQRGRPQGHISGSPGMDVIARDDLMLCFLESDQLAELVRFRNRALSDRLGVGSKMLRTLPATWVSPPSTRARVCASTRVTSGCIARS